MRLMARIRQAHVVILRGCRPAQDEKDNQLIDLYNRNVPLSSIIVWLGLNLNDAEDLVHESFIKLLDHLESERNRRIYAHGSSVLNHNLAMDLFRESDDCILRERGSNSLDTY